MSNIKMGNSRELSVWIFIAIGFTMILKEFASVSGHTSTSTTIPTTSPPYSTAFPTRSTTKPTVICKVDADCGTEHICQQHYGDAKLFLINWTTPDPTDNSKPLSYVTLPADKPPPAGVDLYDFQCSVADQSVIDNLPKHCLCVGAFDIKYSSQPEHGKTMTPKTSLVRGIRRPRQIACVPPVTSITPCEAWYIGTILSGMYAGVIAKSETVQPGHACNSFYEYYLSESLNELVFKDNLYRTMAFFRLTIANPEMRFCNRRRLQSCNIQLGICGCINEYGNMPPYQQSIVGHRAYYDSPIVSFHCYPIAGACKDYAHAVMPQFPEVKAKLLEHYGDPRNPAHLDKQGCLKNYCAQVDRFGERCEPHHPLSADVPLKTSAKYIPGQSKSPPLHWPDLQKHPVRPYPHPLHYLHTRHKIG